MSSSNDQQHAQYPCALVVITTPLPINAFKYNCNHPRQDWQSLIRFSHRRRGRSAPFRSRPWGQVGLDLRSGWAGLEVRFFGVGGRANACYVDSATPMPPPPPPNTPTAITTIASPISTLKNGFASKYVHPSCPNWPSDLQPLSSVYSQCLRFESAKEVRASSCMTRLCSDISIYWIVHCAQYLYFS